MLELVLTDVDATNEKIEQYIRYSSQVDRVCVPTFLITRILEANPKAEISAFVGYPYGLSDGKNKLHETVTAYRNGAKSIDLFVNRIDIVNKQCTTIYDELAACYAVAHERQMDCRIVLESRALEPAEIDKLSEIVLAIGIPGIILASGTQYIDVSDQIIIAKQIMQKTSLQVYCGPIWNEDQYTRLVKSKVYGVRFNSISSFETILKPKKGV